MKKCKKCGLEKRLDEFGKHSKNNDGLRYSCKVCTNMEGKKTYNPEVKREWRLKNRTQILLQQKERYEANKEEIVRKQWEAIKARRAVDSEFDKVYRKQANARSAKYKALNLDKLRPWMLEYNRSYSKKIVQSLSDKYLRGLAIHAGFTKQHIDKYPEILETIKINLQIKRKCKQLQNTLQN